MVAYAGPYEGNGMFKSFTKTWHSAPYPAISPTRSELSVAGKVVFITGGGSGIGKATAIAYAQAGAKAIAIFGRRVAILQSAAEEIAKANPAGTTTVITEGTDISKRESVETAFASAVKKAGGAKVDVLINNAGALQPLGPMTTYSEQDLRASVEANLMGSFYVAQTISPLLAPKAKILNVSSGICHINPIPGIWVYAALKSAIVKMFDSLQAENPDLDVFNIQPGVVETELNKVSGFPGQDDVKLPGHFCLWLASTEAQFLKGKFVWVNWDVEELKAHSKEIEDSMLLRIHLGGLPM